MAEAPHRADTQPRRPRPTLSNTTSIVPIVLPWTILLIVGAIAVTAAIVVTSVVALVFVANTRTVTVIVEGEAVQTRTDALTVGELLLRLNITIGEGDRLTPSSETALQPETIIRVERARTVFLQVDGDTLPWQTLLDSPADILSEAGIRIDDNDRVSIDGTETTLDSLARWPVPAGHIAVRHAVAVQVQDGGESRLIQTTALTVGEALFAAGVTLYTSDSVTPPLDTPLIDDAEVTIERARPVTLIVDGVTSPLRVQGETVADALVESGIALIGMDYSAPSERTVIRPGMAIRVIRVSETIETRDEPIAFQTLYQADAALELDQFQTVSGGTNGILQRRTRVRTENGIAVERNPLEDIIVQAAAPRVIHYGTNVVVRSIDTGTGVRDYWRVIPMWATSYHPAALGGDNITSTGKTLQRGIIGGDPRILPYGTQLYVAGYGVGEIADTGPPQRRRLWIDLGYSDADWVGWARTVNVYILTPVPPTIDYRLMQP
ncbi:MAG: ubiquitin-like domain-containing protein [Chloroflexota bacterium]|nr:ubiquitin-like domain-containing protein [Chloroflexota bacterium]